LKPIEVSLNVAWIEEIMDLIIEDLELAQPLNEEEKEAMENIVVNSIALYQAKISEHLLSKTDTLN
jgi:hypothetical protein